MARHLAPSKKKRIVLPKLNLPRFPGSLSGIKQHARKRQIDRVFSVKDMLLLLGATLVFILSILLPLPQWVERILLVLTALIALFPVLFGQFERVLRHKQPDEDLLVLLAVIAAFCIGENLGGAIAAILYRLGQILEAYALASGDAALDLLREKLPDKVTLESGGEALKTVPEAVDVGDVILVKPGETIALDGVILKGISEIDRSPLTGNEEKVKCGVGEQVFAGSVNCSDPIRIKVTRSFADSAAAEILREVEDSAKYETLPERIANRFAVCYGPAITLLALLLAVIPPLFGGAWLAWLRRAIIFLLISSPSAVLLIVPLASLGAELSGADQGILSKGHDCFEVLARVKTMVFSKTGTITEGRCEITDVFPKGVTAAELLSVAAAAESFSHHPIAAALKSAAGWTPEVADGVMEVEELPGRGISAFIEGRHVYVGNAALLREHGLPYSVPARAGAAVHVAVENRYWGYLMIGDRVREGAFDALEALRIQGVDQMVLLTGDVLSVSRPLASSLGFDMMRPELNMEGKLSAVNYLLSGQGARSSLAYVGDGVKDAPLLERADIGLSIDSLRSVSEADAADILLLDNELALLPKAMRIARTLRRILWENLGVLLGTKLLLIVLALCGVLPIGLAAVISTLSAALALLNALRAFGLD